MFSLKGKKALVTGASGGIGSAIARALDAAGADVIITGTRQEALEVTAANLQNNTRIKPLNLSQLDQITPFFDAVDEEVGGIDIVVANAGITRDNLALRMKEAEWDEVIQVNLSATFYLNKAAFKRMMKRRWGRIINITSVVGASGNAGQANYAASKAGVVGMSKSFALEAASRGITVNCVAPGFVVTDMTNKLTEEQKSKSLAAIPVGALGEVDDIAYPVLFLASEEAKYITGQTLHVNGGMLMP